jgi:uncharacterized membrane protein
MYFLIYVFFYYACNKASVIKPIYTTFYSLLCHAICNMCNIKVYTIKQQQQQQTTFRGAFALLYVWWMTQHIFFSNSSETCSESLRAKWVQRKAHAMLHTNMHKATCSLCFFFFIFFFAYSLIIINIKRESLFLEKAEEIFFVLIFCHKK